MKKSFWWGIGTIAFITIGIYLLFSSSKGQYDELAQCMTDHGTKMYGAYWCPHCQAQKKLFGSSWDLIEYVECASPSSNQQNQVCNAAGIKSYPTWAFSDGNTISGELSLQQLASFSNCTLITE